MYPRTLFVFASLMIWLPCQCMADAVMTFEDITAGTQYSVGDSIFSGGFELIVGGDPGTNTITQVTSFGFAGLGNGLESFADRELIFQLAQSSPQIDFRFSNRGGSNFMIINGVTTPSVGGFGQLNGLSYGGVSVQADAIFNGTLTLTGEINSLVVSGQELLVDNISVQSIPEAHSIIGVLLACGIALRRRKNSVC